LFGEKNAWACGGTLSFFESNASVIIQNDKPNNLCLQEISSPVYLTQTSVFLFQITHSKTRQFRECD